MINLEKIPSYVKLEITKEDLIEFANQIVKQIQPTPQIPEKDILNISEAADYLGLAKQTLYGYTSTNKIPFKKVNKKLFFDKKDLLKWLDKGKVQCQSEVEEELNNYLRRNTNNL